MIAYVDSSVILRMLLGQPQRLKEWKSIETSVMSALVEVECLRTLDRLRVIEGLADNDVADLRETVYRLLSSSKVVDVSRPILDRAAQPLPTALGTLDAIHLATAVLWRDLTRSSLVMATHDEALGRAARSVGLPVLGL